MTEKEVIQLFYKRDISQLDDCTLLPKETSESSTFKQILNTDSLVENVHFSLQFSSPINLATKLFHINLSDLCSSGAVPTSCILNMGIPTHMMQGEIGEKFIKKFAKSFLSICDAYNCPLIAGDSFRAPHLYLSLSMLGKVQHYTPRYGGNIGDDLYLTGNVGLSLLGYLHLIKKMQIPKNLANKCIKKFLAPQAPYELSLLLNKDPAVSAAIDLSDGLFFDARSLAQASNVQLEIELDKIPALPAVRAYLADKDILASAEEFELLFLAAPSFGLRHHKEIHRIGRALPMTNKGAVTYMKAGKNYPSKQLESSHLWSHF